MTWGQQCEMIASGLVLTGMAFFATNAVVHVTRLHPKMTPQSFAFLGMTAVLSGSALFGISNLDPAIQ